MSADPSPLSLISGRQDRLERRLNDVEGDVEEIPVLRKEVQLLTKAVDRNTNALYSVVGTIVATATVGFLLARGVIG
ncbi:MAG TPA: hypothetical protein VN758_00510 [Solirubrobacterales bacterium]|nr:hypothetical protein [Solirubrobacterales bacterium]